MILCLLLSEVQVLILEFADNLKNDINSGWVHISYNSKEKNRHQCLTINKKIGTKIGLLK